MAQNRLSTLVTRTARFEPPALLVSLLIIVGLGMMAVGLVSVVGLLPAVMMVVSGVLRAYP